MKNLKNLISKNVQTILMSALTLAVIGTAFVYATSIGADTIQVGADGTAGKLELYSEQGGTDYELTLQPDGAMTQDTVYTFPVDDGDVGEVLSTDGGGDLDWVADVGGDFSDGGEATGANRTLGNTDDFSLGFITNSLTRMLLTTFGGRTAIGLGMGSPEYLLDLVRDDGALIRGRAENEDTEFEVYGKNSKAFLRLANADNQAVIKFGSQEAASKGWAFVGKGSGKDYRLDIASEVNLSENHQNDGTIQVTIQQDGKVGIGTKNPKAELEVDGGIRLNQDDAVKPACDGPHRGELWFTRNSGPVSDTLEVCARVGGGGSAWRTLW